METVRFVEYRGFRILVGFDVLRIDPLATQKKVLEKIQTTELWGKFLQKQDALSQANSFADCWFAIKEFEVIKSEYEHEYARLWELNLVHFNPRRNELVLSQDQIGVLKNLAGQLKQGELLTIEGQTIFKTP